MSASPNSRHGDDGSVTAQVVQSPSSMRFAAGASGFLTFIQKLARPDRYGDPSRFDTMPSQPRAQACLKMIDPSPS